ncbi:MAG TPA: nucleotidyltransferase family protein [Methylovirgula sp.]|nr:nucleotidyltransferase family protein [Methylovirgula sp.]
MSATTSSPADIAAVILAAGLGTRFGAGTPKVLAQLAGKPLLRHVAEAAAQSQAHPLIVVLGDAASEAEAALAGLSANIVRNDNTAAGLSHSLALGLETVPEHCAGALVLLADMPRVNAAMIDSLVAAFHAAQEPPRAVIPTNAGQRGNPVLLGRAIFAEVMQLQGDRGAAALLRSETRGIVECPIDDEAIAIDVDTPDALAALARHIQGTRG